MGFTFVNEQQEQISFNWRGWRKVFTLAKMGGWQPAGTKRPEGWDDPERDYPKWGGTYFCNDGQRVTAEDAAALATALERMLDDIPDHEIERPDLVPFRPQDWSDPKTQKRAAEMEQILGLTVGPDPGLGLLEVFAGPAGKQRVRDMIDFCRQGSFVIL